MPYNITQVGDTPILLVELFDPFDFCEGPSAIRAEILSVLGAVPRPFFVIYDLRELSITFNDIINALVSAAYPQANAKEILQKYGRMSIVGAGPLITLGIKGANRFVPSSGTTKAFNTPEEALEYARSQLAGSG